MPPVQATALLPGRLGLTLSLSLSLSLTPTPTLALTLTLTLNKVVELRQLLSVRGCNTRGRKAELVSRLQQAVDREAKA